VTDYLSYERAGISNITSNEHSSKAQLGTAIIIRVTRRPGFGSFVSVSRKTFSGRKNVLVFKNQSTAHNKSSLIGLICAKSIHVSKLSLKSQRLLDY
jgi:hypothetical protein